VAIVVLGVLLAGGASARGVHPRHLDPVPAGALHRLAEDFVFSEKAATFTLAAGEYRVAFEDRRARYLVGAHDCLSMRVVPPRQPEAAYTMPFDCGIKLPKDPAQPADVFVIRDAPRPESLGQGVLIDAIIRGGSGKFDFPARLPDGAALRAALTVVDVVEGED